MALEIDGHATSDQQQNGKDQDEDCDRAAFVLHERTEQFLWRSPFVSNQKGPRGKEHHALLEKLRDNVNCHVLLTKHGLNATIS
jgi:hypothetical protein